LKRCFGGFKSFNHFKNPLYQAPRQREADKLFNKITIIIVGEKKGNKKEVVFFNPI